LIPEKVFDMSTSAETTTSSQDNMELTADLAMRSRPFVVIADSIVEARRHPTNADWQRWRPIIAMRYKSVPARVIIQEMKAEYPFVT
jgi:prophage tail gpP-like protein